MVNPAEVWKGKKHSFDVWPDVLRHAGAATPMAEIETPDLERMKWYGFFYRKRDTPGRYMNRIRITANELTSDQAREIAAVAYEHGHGIVDVTTRANLQVQGLGIEHVPEVAERLSALGLTSKQTGHDNVRNVFAHPFSGVLPDELIDTRQLCREVTALFVDSREYSDLPRKFNICLNGAAEHSVHFWTQDLSFLARRVGREVLFQVLVAGTQGQNPRLAWHLPVLVRPDQVVAVTAAVLDLFRAQGSREKRHQARLRYLVERIGIEGVQAYVAERVALRPWPDLPPPAPAARNDDLIGWFPQRRPDHWTMGLAVPLGRLGWRQLEALAVLAKRWGSGALRTTHEQGIAIVDIPRGFRDAAATDAAAVGLSMHADTLARNTVACTGTQFCNIAVTETKGAMFRLIETLRQRALALHGIRIHMSGCPSSCAQHFTADIGLKGVRVRRLLGTREGFDVYLGGGVAGDVHLGLRYKLGVDVEQLPLVIEEVVNEYYLRHGPGETFSAYWRAKLREAAAAKVAEDDYRPSTWICERCDHRHRGEDPPVFCPGCAGVRRLFVRVDDDASTRTAAPSQGGAVAGARVEEGEATGAERSFAGETPAARDDGFVFAVREDALRDGAAVAVDIGGRTYALLRIDGKVAAIDGLCPHEGGPLAEGTVQNGTVTCPWHGWTFDACTGCSLDPPGNDVGHYPTLVEGGSVYVRPQTAAPGTASAVAGPAVASPAGAGTAGADSAGADSEGADLAGADSAGAGSRTGVRPLPVPSRPPARPATAELTVAEVRDEAPGVRTFRLDNTAGRIPHRHPGTFVQVTVPLRGVDVRRSFTVSSSPTDPAHLELTIKRNPDGQVTNHLFEAVRAGSALAVRGTQGGFYFDPAQHPEPLVLVSAGSGITPVMSIARFLAATDQNRACTFVHGARSARDIIFRAECERLGDALPSFRYHVSLSRPGPRWAGGCGRLDGAEVAALVPDLAGSRYFLCGPPAFMDAITIWLRQAGVPADRVHTEQFNSARRLAQAG